MTKPREAVLRLFRVGHNRAAMFEPKNAIFPSQRAPVVRRAEDGERELVELSWGFVLLREGYAPKRVTNARDDKLLTRFWRTSFEGRRCLVPATAFCEPHDNHKPTTWHWFALRTAATNEYCRLSANPLKWAVRDDTRGKRCGAAHVVSHV
jgi:putative SOS response-associated peptidase YedK